MQSVDSLELRCLRSEAEVHAARPLEEAGYSAEEGASLESMLYRYRNARRLFLGAFDSTGAIVGYIMSTQGAAPLVTHASMEEHDPQGTTVCIHSVCVKESWQRKGVALKLLQAYTELVRGYNAADRKEAGGPRLRRLAMLSRKNLVPLYTRAGYSVLGESDVVHGTETWYDCVLDLEN
ncbi:hypothetical protein GGF46_002046 [Coemansia sp. RSA 552]|nr:hypothetical protein GGF46_002046 [Coemansia sp. RSA 552]